MNKQRSWSRPIGVALTCFALSSCYKATFIRDAQVVRGKEHDQWTTFFLFGLVGTEEVEVKDFCPDRDVAVVRTGGNFGTGFVSAITIGIYTPRKVYITCAKADSQEARLLELELDQTGRPLEGRLITDSGTQRVEVATSGANQWALSVQESSL